MSKRFARHGILCAIAVLSFAAAAHDDDDHDGGRSRWFSARDRERRRS
jgi:hypothetical protein